jgi:hypothetical protein
MTGRFLKIGVPLAILALVITAFAAQSPRKMAEIEALKAPTPTFTYSRDRYNLPVADGRYTGEIATTSSRSTSLLDNRRSPAPGLAASAQTSPGLVVCGSGDLAGTTYDFHHNDDNQQMIAVLPTGGSFVHFAWTHWDRIPDSLDGIDRFCAYSTYSQATGLPFGQCGKTLDVGVALKARAGFPTVDVATGDRGMIAMHARDVDEQALGSNGMYTVWIFQQGSPGFPIFGNEQLGNASSVEEGQCIWPHMRIDLLGGDNGAKSGSAAVDVFHVVSHPTGDGRIPAPTFDNQLIYYRRVGQIGAPWEGPVALDDNAGGLSYHVAVDPTSPKCAVFYQRDDLDAAQLLQNGYLESPDNGANWIAEGLLHPFPTVIEPFVGPYHQVTTYAGPEGDNPQSWLEVHGEYDLDGVKHMVWSEQIFSNLTAEANIRHWDEINGFTTIKQALGWDNDGTIGGRDIWLAVPNLAFGDGSTTCNDGPGDLTNRNYVYVTYEQYGGPTAVEVADKSASDNALNLEIYISASNDKGATFSPSVNLTNTKSPGCDGTVPGMECASERDPSMAHVVNDTVHIIYILDTDAGDAVFGQGFWTFNPVMYYRIPGGTDADILCPEIAPVFASQLTNGDADCEYHAPTNGSQVEELRINNFGNATLSGSVAKVNSSSWLQMSEGPFTILAGDPTNTRAVTMNGTIANGISGEGLYQDIIRITHDDPSAPSPHDIPVDFFVFDEFYCPEFITLNTGWLWLEVSNVERQANQSSEDGGLSRRATDTSYSIYDASLIIGVPPNPDTLVFRNIFGTGNGQPGFRALGNLIIDTSAYGSNTGAATATAAQTTSDSTMGVDVTYVFPQDPDSCEFVLIKYKLTNRTASTINGIVVGQAQDFDVIPSLHNVDSIQIGSQNTGHLAATPYNLIYQQGVDTVNHVPVGDRTATRFKGGITAIQDFQAPRAWIAPNDPWLFGRTQNGGGFSEGYLYDQMTKTGFELFDPVDPDPEEDLHAVMVMEQGVNLGPNDVKRYLIGYVSSTVGNDDDTDLLETTRKAWRYCFGWNEFVQLDSLDVPAGATQYPYFAIGSHELGWNGGCYGCVVSEVADVDAAFSIAGGCEGTISFTPTLGASVDHIYEATYRVEDLCGDNSDECVIKVVVGNPVVCLCPWQGDIDSSGAFDAVDLNEEIDLLFFNVPDIQDPLCPTTRGDLDYSGAADAVDLNYMIDLLFFNHLPPCDPCTDIGDQDPTRCYVPPGAQ